MSASEVASNPFWYVNSTAALSSRDRLSIFVLAMCISPSTNLDMTGGRQTCQALRLASGQPRSLILTYPIGRSPLSQCFELILCSEHTIDRSAHLFQNKSRRQATHHFELIRLTWTNFKSIGLHSFDGDLNHFFHLHDRSAFHVFNIKVTQEFGLCRGRCQVEYLHFGVFQLHTKRLGKRMQTGLGGAINR